MPPHTGQKAATFARRVDDRLRGVALRLRGVEIENTDALQLIRRWDQPKTCLYLDPPYLNETRISKNAYANDNGGHAFHAELVDLLRSFSGAVVLSGYPNALYDTLGWRTASRDVSAPTSTNAADGATRRTEVLWVKEPGRIITRGGRGTAVVHTAREGQASHGG